MTSSRADTASSWATARKTNHPKKSRTNSVLTACRHCQAFSQSRAGVRGCATTFRGGDLAGRTRYLAFQRPLSPREGSRARTHDLQRARATLRVGRASPLVLRSYSSHENQSHTPGAGVGVVVGGREFGVGWKFFYARTGATGFIGRRLCCRDSGSQSRKVAIFR